MYKDNIVKALGAVFLVFFNTMVELPAIEIEKKFLNENTYFQYI